MSIASGFSIQRNDIIQVPHRQQYESHDAVSGLRVYLLKSLPDYEDKSWNWDIRMGEVRMHLDRGPNALGVNLNNATATGVGASGAWATEREAWQANAYTEGSTAAGYGAIEYNSGYGMYGAIIFDTSVEPVTGEKIEISYIEHTTKFTGDGGLLFQLAHDMCIHPYNTPEIFQKLAILFSKTALEVCDGQQLDIDFETRNDVTIDEYLNMIRLKTSVLVAAALKMGAIVAESSEKNANLLYEYGLNLGLAFQLQDDYLDTFGNPETFGKQVGGDIIENKKTYLYLKAMELSSDDNKQKLAFFYNQKLEDNSIKIDEVKRIFEKYEIPSLIQQLIHDYTSLAFNLLEKMNMSKLNKEKLTEFGSFLMARDK